MRDVDIISDEYGPHSGWRRQQFKVGEQLYELFTITRDDDERSSIRKMENEHTGDSFLHLECIIGPNDARDIIYKMNTVRSLAYEAGRTDLQRKLKELLNIS